MRQKLTRPDHRPREARNPAALARRPGAPLDSGMRAHFEAALGHDFGRVRIHHDPASAGTAAALGARAFTTGEHIAFGPGRFAPHTGAGRRLIAHELAHVVQQRRGLVLPGGFGSPSDAHERQADAVADRAARGESARELLGAPPPAAGAAAPAAVQFDAETAMPANDGPAPPGRDEPAPSLPDRIASAAVDALLKIAIEAVEAMPESLFAGGGVGAMVWLFKAAAVGFLRRLAREGGAKVLAAVKNVAAALQSPDYTTAFVKGFLHGFFVEGLFGLFVLIWDLGRLIFGFGQWVSGIAERLVDKFFSLGLAHELVALAGRLLAQREAIAGLRAKIASGGIAREVFDFLQSIGPKVQGFVRTLGDSVAEKMIELFTGETGQLGATLGNVAGNVAGFGTFVIVEGILTAGGGSALSLLGKALQKVLSAGSKVGSALIKGAREAAQLASGALKGLVTALRQSKAFAKLGELLDELVAKLTKLLDRLPDLGVDSQLATAGGPHLGSELASVGERAGGRFHMSQHTPPAGGAGDKLKVSELSPPKNAEVPKAEVPKAEVPKGEVPKGEAPKAEKPNAEATTPGEGVEGPSTTADSASGPGAVGASASVDTYRLRKSAQKDIEAKTPVSASSVGTLVGHGSRRSFRRAVARLIAVDGHPLNFLLKNGQLRNTARKGMGARVWLETPELVEAGHVLSEKAGGRAVVLMSAYRNRIEISAMIEHPQKARGAMLIDRALDIGGVAVDIALALDWLAAGRIGPEVIRNAKLISF